MYLVTAPLWLRMLYPKLIWKGHTDEKVVFLTFDDGPHPTITSWVLKQLKQYNALASFFCIGKNVLQHISTFEEIVFQNHAIGNHTFDHLNGWQTPKEVYLANILHAQKIIPTYNFRPPYGKMKYSDIRLLQMQNPKWRIFMWSLLSGDFSAKISPQQCIDNVLNNVTPGSIIVFHDSQKAFKNLEATLPVVLAHLYQKGYQFRTIQGI